MEKIEKDQLSNPSFILGWIRIKSFSEISDRIRSTSFDIKSYSMQDISAIKSHQDCLKSNVHYHFIQFSLQYACKVN